MFPLLVRFVAVLLFLTSAWSRAAEVIGPPQVVLTSPTSATVRWRTDVPTGTRVSYGLAAERLNQSAESALTDAHEVTLTGLQAGTKYFYAVGTARKLLTTGQFVTSSSPAAATAPVSTSPAAIPKPKSVLAKIFAPAAPTIAPPARQTWGNFGSLQDHFARHGPDFAAKSPEDYAAQAWQFRQRARAGGLLVKVDDDGVQRVFDPATGAFAAYNRDGTTKTYFKPDSRDYFERQPGRPVKTVTP
jgi:hypothetical protein